MTRYQRLATATVAATLLLVTIGVIVRATESGMGCPDWPLCHGQLVPALDDYHAWLEWIHRAVASVIGFLILGLAFLGWRDHRRTPAIMWGSFLAVVLVGFQAWLGEETVRLGNSGPSVTAHLASAMALEGLLVLLLVRSSFPARIAGRGASQLFTLLAAFGAAATYGLLLFGSNVTATDQALVYPDWPLMGGTFFPPVIGATSAQVLHRWVAVVVGLILIAVWLVAWRTQRDRRPVFVLATLAAALYPLQAVIGGLQVLTQLAAWAQTLHVALGALIWGAMAGLTVTSYYAARTTYLAGPGPSSRRETDEAILTEPGHRPLRETISAYVALTKPRIIELLLVTTVPAMVLASREVPGIGYAEFGWLVAWTLVAGSLAAGSANAINCYLDRDIDLLMTRTRRRPLPANRVEPENALVFGLVLGAISLAVMTLFVNLVAAFLTLLAIAFYVLVYTLLLKRTTPQNIVIGGAAGALPPVIGWAAVTGNVGIPALLLFALVFYWTPPHFWALSLRIRRDYEAARIPMLPVVRGIPETTRQIGLYSVLLVAISLVFFAVARMGAIYLIAAVVLGAAFLWQAYRLWRVGSSEEGSTAGAIALYRYSITYLTLLFLAVAVDSIVLIPLG
ncbi:MAG TPA: heme o synthase [Candidatus Dormibacteraeota bacterium]|nr:heme o synthase [Candidatus Dormibacteraeota bacterium]